MGVPDFSPVIRLAYLRILGRPADAGGLQIYNQAMNAGLTEAQMRESLLRSPEYANNNPDAALERASGSSKKKKKTAKKTSKKSRKR